MSAAVIDGYLAGVRQAVFSSRPYRRLGPVARARGGKRVEAYLRGFADSLRAEAAWAASLPPPSARDQLSSRRELFVPTFGAKLGIVLRAEAKRTRAQLTRPTIRRGTSDELYEAGRYDAQHDLRPHGRARWLLAWRTP